MNIARNYSPLRRTVLLAAACASLASSLPAAGAAQDTASTNKALVPDAIFNGLKPRLIGPAFMSGRIGDLAVDPKNSANLFMAVASGGVWKSTNAGITWAPVFDKQGSYSIGCVTLDPRNANVVWVGTGENNSQRSAGWGDGVYRSRDGGQNWERVGLTNSEHVGRIVVHPQNSDLVYVAAQGPLWSAGGERGLYKTTDGGKTWERILFISEHTGVNEVLLDPRDPDTVYASAYQRRRHVWTLIDGGPESGLHKSTDGGKTWRKLTSGLPDVDKGRIGLAISPANPDILYAVVEAAEGKGGFFRSVDRGESWHKRNDFVSSSPQYFNELFADPVLPDRVYAVDVYLQVSDDGGKTFRRVPGRDRHVDDHALWIDPRDNEHLWVGCDGGLYETYDLGANWRFTPNLPITQFYRVSADNALPFYNVFGGTQDNASEGGPSRTLDRVGIPSSDWFVTVGGDGYETVVDPTDPNILYALWQYGGLVRFDRRSGEVMDIKPREKPGEPPLKWNWDSPLILSPHNPQRLYFAANRLYRTDDRGNSWTAVSGDLTRGIDRSTLPVMGKVQNVDAVARNKSTSFYGNSTALSESPLQENLVWVGTDDGLIHVTTDGGKNWKKLATFPGVPETTYVSGLTASRHATNAIYASFDNHKQGDFKPYLLKSTDLGATWTSAAGDLPAREVVYCVQEDHERADLLFAGTEFGAWFTLDGGKHWARVSGIPTIAVRDIEIQRRENDVIFGTFGRSIYILDDYTPLRFAAPALTNEVARIFPVKDALRYIERNRLGNRSGRGWQGATYYAAANPPFGAVLTYYLKDKPLSRREQRKEAEKKLGTNQPVRIPPMDELRAEDREAEPVVQMIISEADGTVLRRLPASRESGLHRMAWDLRYPAADPVQLKGESEGDAWDEASKGPLALPGTYTATLVKLADGKETPLAGPVKFNVVPLDTGTFTAPDKPAVVAFQRKVARLQRAVEGAGRVADEASERLKHLRRAVQDTPGADAAWLARNAELTARLQSLLADLRGDPVFGKFEEPSPPTINSRVQDVVGGQWHVTAAPTQTQRDDYRYAAEAFEKWLADLRTLVEQDLKALEAQLETAGAPWTPSRIPVWKREAD